MREQVKVIYRNRLGLKKEELAVHVSKCVLGLGVQDPMCTIDLEGVSDTKFKKLLIAHRNLYIHIVDYMEVCAAWIEK